MPIYLTDQSPMSPQYPTRNGSHKRYAVPDPADRAACARFGMQRRKVSRDPGPCPEYHSTISKLQETVRELSCQINRLYKTVLQQALTFRDHLFLIPKCYFRMILPLFCRRSYFPLCVLAMWGNLSRQEVVLHYHSPCLVPKPPFCALKVQETSDPSDLFSSFPLLVSCLVMTLRYTTFDYPQNLVVDRMTMRCLIRPPHVTV